MRIKAAVIIGTVPLRPAAAPPTWPLGDSHQPISRQHVRLPQTPYTAPPGGDLSPHDPCKWILVYFGPIYFIQPFI